MIRRPIPPLRRGLPQREPKRRFTIVCEGKCTEPAYFEQVRRLYSAALIEIEVVSAVGVPVTVAETAVARSRQAARTARRRGGRDSFEEQDEIWAVFDRDDHPHYNDAVALCQQHKIGVARSNPCFEVWLILHEREYDKPDDRHAVQRYLRDLRPEYDPHRGKSPDCSDLINRLVGAEQRAKAQLARRTAEGAPFGVPSTTVFKLTFAIRQAAHLATPRTK